MGSEMCIRDSHCSLREAILAANDSINLGAPDEILFDLGGIGPHTISLSTSLPDITDPVTIDGRIDISAAKLNDLAAPPSMLNIEIDGSGMTSGPIFRLMSADISLIKLAIGGGPDIAIDIRGADAVIKSNFIGLKPNGTTPAGNGGSGIYVNALGAMIGGTEDNDGNIIGLSLIHI